jgi:hypothetical protein
MFENLFNADMPLAARFVNALTLLGGIAAAVVMVIILWRAFKRPNVVHALPEQPVEIARIVEHQTWSTGGAFAVALLVLSNLFAIVTYAVASNILQQNVAMLGWIGWNILWGIGAIVGRKRTYTVYRTPPPPERSEQRAE